MRTIDQGNVSIDVVDVWRPHAEPVNRVFMLFGEHSRELISPESGLHLLKVLCGDAGDEETRRLADEVLLDSRFQLVLNSNPRSRQQVELGDFCLRENPEGVDLNRNWDEKWQPEPKMHLAQTNPGRAAFSEKETQIFKDLVTKYAPTSYLSIHSGTMGMYMPWAYDMKHLADRNQPAMMEILRTVDAAHCKCPFGAAGKEVGYSCPGTSLDWIYDKLKTPYAFAFEIYINEEHQKGLRARWEEKMVSEGAAFLQEHSHLGHEHFSDVFQHHHSDFVQQRRQKVSESSMGCFKQFNPRTEEVYQATVSNWATAYLEVARLVAKDLRKKHPKALSKQAAFLQVTAGGSAMTMH